MVKKSLSRVDFDRWMQIFTESTSVLLVPESTKTEIIEYLKTFQHQIVSDDNVGSDEQLGSIK